MERNKAPNAAFACVFEHKGVEYKLARHHKLDTVVDGSEHDTVDPALLAFALRTIDQLPVDEATREDVRRHLKEHEAALAKDVNRAEMTEERAERIVQQQAGGKDGNETLTNPKVDVEMKPEASAVVRKDGGSTTAVRQEGGSGSIAGGTPTQPGQKDTDAGKPKGDHQDTLDVNLMDDPEKKSGNGTPAHPPKVSEGPKDSSKPGVETDGGQMVKGNPATNDSANVPTSKGSAKEKSDSGPRDALPKGAKPKMMNDKKGKAQDGEPMKKGKDGDPEAQDDGDSVKTQKGKSVKKK